MSDTLEYLLKLSDQLSPVMKNAAGVTDSEATRIANNIRKIESQAAKAQAPVKTLGTELDGLKTKMLGGFSIGGILGGLGIGAGIFGIGELVKSGLEKIHSLHEAEAALQNTMKNMGRYTDEGFERVIKNSEMVSQGIKFSKIEVIDLQSQLRLVGNIGEKEMNRLVAVSADMATKFHLGLNEAGNAIAKAVNNPEMLRRLAMQLKIDPSMVAHLQALAKNGQEAQARLELLNIVEQKVGGAAVAAFNADPMAKYNKTTEQLEITIGDLANQIRVALLPYAVRFLEWLKSAVEWVKQNSAEIWGWIKTLGEAWLAFKVLSGAQVILTSLGTAIETAGGSMAAFGESMLVAVGPAGWITLVVLAIGGLINELNTIGDIKRKVRDDNWTDQQNKETEYLKSLVTKYEKMGLKHKDAFDRTVSVEQAALNQQTADENAKLWPINSEGKRVNKFGVLQPQSVQIGVQAKLLDISKQQDALNSFKASGADKISPLTKTETAPGISKEKADKINHGGQRTIVINIGKQIEKLEIHTMTAKEGVDEMGSMIREELKRVLYSVNEMEPAA